MIRKLIVGVVACSLVGGCGEQASVSGPGLKSQGRYAGIGTYTAGRLWAELADSSATSSATPDDASARLADDDQIIVVVDSHTGEVRQCGNYSGVCVAMSPWLKARSPVPAPVKLNRHAADLAAADEAAAK